jgi:hypothetical protein
MIAAVVHQVHNVNVVFALVDEAKAFPSCLVLQFWIIQAIALGPFVASAGLLTQSFKSFLEPESASAELLQAIYGPVLVVGERKMNM